MAHWVDAIEHASCRHFTKHSTHVYYAGDSSVWQAATPSSPLPAIPLPPSPFVDKVLKWQSVQNVQFDEAARSEEPLCQCVWENFDVGCQCRCCQSVELSCILISNCFCRRYLTQFARSNAHKYLHLFSATICVSAWPAWRMRNITYGTQIEMQLKCGNKII